MGPSFFRFIISSFPFSEFLNVDDDDIDEDDDDDNMPGAEDAPRLTENSGWSSRTRCVLLPFVCANIRAKYGKEQSLQNCFLGGFGSSVLL